MIKFTGKIQKKYKRGYADMIWKQVVALLLILDSNLISNTFHISSKYIVLINIYSILILLFIIVLRTYTIHNNLKKQSENTISYISSVNIKRILWSGWVVIIPLLILFFLDKNNIKLTVILISIALLYIIKTFFDNVVVISDKGFSSGFDKVILNNECYIKEIKRKINDCGEFVVFEIYRNDKRIVLDEFSKIDYDHLWCSFNSNVI